jgi:hypothetical protein
MAGEDRQPVEDAGGAYAHDTFDEHRAFLEENLAAGETVGYFPETAFWVAFDNSGPTYLPLYVRSRWTDLAAFRDLEDHGILGDVAHDNRRRKSATIAQGHPFTRAKPRDSGRMAPFCPGQRDEVARGQCRQRLVNEEVCHAGIDAA